MSRLFERITGLSGKTAAITGALDGIGVGIAKALAGEGLGVAINFAKHVGADRVVAEIKAKGGNAIAVHGDVSNATDVQKIFAETKQAFGRLDILVNNASVQDLLSLEEVTDEGFHRYFNRSVLGLLLATQEATKLFGVEGGRVINVNAVASDRDPRNSAYYTATRMAIDSVTQTLAMDLGVKKIRINSIEVIVQRVDALPPTGNAIEFADDSIVELLSSYICGCAMASIDSGTYNIHVRRPKVWTPPFASEGALSEGADMDPSLCQRRDLA